MYIIITGTSGYLGGYLLKEFSNLFNISVLGLTRSPNPEENELSAIGISEDSLYKMIRDKIPNGQAVVFIHCAAAISAESYASYFASNVTLTEKIVRLANRLQAKNFIHMSTGSVYGVKGLKRREEHRCEPEGDYAKTKLISESVVADQFEVDGGLASIFRIYFPYGENGTGLVDRLIDNYISCDPVVLNVGGTPVFSSVHVKDVFSLVLKVVESSRTGLELLNVCSDEFVSVGEVLEMCCRISNKRLNITHSDLKHENILAENSSVLDIYGDIFSVSIQGYIRERLDGSLKMGRGA